MASLARDLGAKRLQLLKDAFPRIAHVGVLFEPADVGGLPQVNEIKEAATRLGIRVTPIELRRAADIEPAFQRGAAVRVDAYMTTQSFLFANVRQAIVDGMLRSKVPALFASVLQAEGGGLMSYGPLWQDSVRRVAWYVDKILKGAKPRDLPIEPPSKVELGLNLKTAKGKGNPVPPSI